MLWLRWIEPDLGKLVWPRVSGTEWKPIFWRFGISRPTAHRRWEFGLSVIVSQPNGRRVPTKRGRRVWCRGRGEYETASPPNAGFEPIRTVRSPPQSMLQNE